jgi:phosphoribosylglycinamide formyltransferase-1
MVGGTPLKVAILISGRGSNMLALAEACQAGDYPAEVAAVISNRPDAQGLTTAAGLDIPTKVVEHTAFDSRDAFDNALSMTIEESGADLICLAGFMRLLGAPFVEHWRDRLINIHPSLLPAFKGLDTHAQVFAAGARFTGCTVHFVRPAMDEGPIILQAALAVDPNDTEDSLAARVLEQEHRIYPLAVRWIAENRVAVENETVTVAGASASLDARISPEVTTT